LKFEEGKINIVIVSVNHTDQISPLREETRIPEVMEKKEKVRSLVKAIVASGRVDLICEESNPCHLSIAQEEAFNRKPRIPWKNINMTSQERLEAGVWEPLLYRPYDLEFTDEANAIKIEYRVPEDDVREEFFKDEILRTAKERGAKNVLVLCGDMHTEALKRKLENAGCEVKTDRSLTPKKHWH